VSGAPDLRANLLRMTPSELGLQPTEELPHVWAAVFDWGMEGGAASIIAVADGSVSMYTSSGGGMIGAGEHDSVRVPAARFLRTVESILGSLTPATDALLPRANEFALVALTYEGTRRAVVDLRLLQRADPLARAWIAGQDVITALRELQEKPPARG
jgi:hypothetical protein